ncbi:hypothetical protein FPSE_10107 [Fusarium pseudograminearum CS3096]|uniref:Sulfatase N-terminal domain-containing protein n=1 Tax=Fusarium pseudograminearum (strain CS3096) TaxID=1028729 RepID=K3VBL1_FUSPC|nr:hypothetical protein FPSE_10107 [Fusarium pseudograminearum CS3096]EKJ69693.1 hypothetical protein FPSE_10107 [Fusarium pseudograminearum CS3096]
MADDLGFSNYGCYSSEISTPNIDSLTSQAGGIRVTDFHVAATCSPTRSVLTGPGGYLEERVTTLSQLLRHGGYFTSMSGKWHLGPKPEHHPNERGLNTSLALLPDCAHRYGILPYSHTKPVLIAITMLLYEPEYDDPRSEPGKVFETASRAIHVQNGKFLLEGEQGPECAEGNIATDAFCTVMDIIPTILDYAGLQHPNSHAGRPAMPLRGKNWMHVLDRLQKISRSDSICNQDYVVDFKTKCSGAIRRGDWKINLVPAPKGPKCWELFNID